MTCSPLSSTLVKAIGYAFDILRNPSTILGNSAGFNGSTDSFMTDSPPTCGNFSGAKIRTSSSSSSSLPPVLVMVAVFAILASTPSIKTQFPAVATFTSVLYLPLEIETDFTTAYGASSSSSGEYASPGTLTLSPCLIDPRYILPNAENVCPAGGAVPLEVVVLDMPLA
eukprot:CAMPEP_0203650712 /NCGR_PEP_ID=MMETSP0088-20131115/25477_1 /ASSEMBLY_ACC=CAM_ASM_001087 /TAXON_ID=426623 /ORGANISM="Chaetoceros affinis, Strain CCMP159" /LENGTH=168 /DNA_ID=CAMNT_0050509595 /DNA_START=164 /DNA_END=670 /DNA_ORIENTATION=+